MRVVFMGTPDLSARVLSTLSQSHEVVGVFTRPDAVRGRGRKLVASPVKEEALKSGIPVFTPKTMKDPLIISQIEELRPEVICVAAYGAILPPAVLESARLGCLNVHTSLLPRWRGAAPIERAILEGDRVTGVCIMRMEKGLDTGPYCAREEMTIGERDVAELSRELADLGAKLLVESMSQVQEGTARWVKQREEGLTYAHKIEKGELDASPEDGVSLIQRKVRASSSAHPSKAMVAGKTLTLERVRVADEGETPQGIATLEPGRVAFASKRLFAAALDGVFEILRVKPDGKKSMDARSFAAGIQGIKNDNVTWGRA